MAYDIKTSYGGKPKGWNDSIMNQPDTRTVTANKAKTGGTKKSKEVMIRLANDPNAEKMGIPVKAIKAGAAAAAGASNSFFSATKTVASRSAITYSKAYKSLIEPTGNALGGTAENIDNFSSNLTSTLDSYTSQLRTNLTPISEFMGSTLGTVTGVLQDPLGSNGLGNIATKMLNTVAPGYGEKINNINKKLNLDAMARLPSQMMTSLNHIATAIDNVLAVPLALVSEIYYGYMAIMKSISKLINSVVDGFFKLLMNFLDSIIPINAIMGLLNQISTLAGQIGGIAGTFLGANAITGFTNQIASFTSQIGDVISNPMNLVSTYIPTQVTQFMNVLENPQSLINQYLPPGLSEAFSKISSITGFGFNGNMGYGFESVLKGVQGGVVKSMLTNFSAQYNILAPLLAGSPDLPSDGNRGYRPTLIGGKYNNGLINEVNRSTAPQYRRI